MPIHPLLHVMAFQLPYTDPPLRTSIQLLCHLRRDDWLDPTRCNPGKQKPIRFIWIYAEKIYCARDTQNNILKEYLSFNTIYTVCIFSHEWIITSDTVNKCDFSDINREFLKSNKRFAIFRPKMARLSQNKIQTYWFNAMWKISSGSVIQWWTVWAGYNQ